MTAVIAGVSAFLLAPGAFAYSLRTASAWRVAAVSSAALPVGFVVGIVLDGPILTAPGRLSTPSILFPFLHARDTEPPPSVPPASHLARHSFGVEDWSA